MRLYQLGNSKTVASWKATGKAQTCLMGKLPVCSYAEDFEISGTYYSSSFIGPVAAERARYTGSQSVLTNTANEVQQDDVSAWKGEGMPQEGAGYRRIRTRRWAPIAVLFITWAFSAIGWDANGGKPSIPWALGGLAVGICVVWVIHRMRKR